MAETKSCSTWVRSPARSRPWSTNTQVSRSPMARCTRAAATAESTPPDSPQIARPSPICVADPLDLLLDDRRRRPLRLDAGDVAQEPAQHLLAVRRMRDLRVVLDAGEAALDVFEAGDLGAVGGGRDDRALRGLGDAVVVAHPRGLVRGQAGVQDTAVTGDADLGAAELADAGRLDDAAERAGQQLVAVADAEHRDAGFGELRVHARRAFGVHARRAAGEDDGRGVLREDLFGGRAVRRRPRSRSVPRGRAGRSAARTAPRSPRREPDRWGWAPEDLLASGGIPLHRPRWAGSPRDSGPSLSSIAAYGARYGCELDEGTDRPARLPLERAGAPEARGAHRRRVLLGAGRGLLDRAAARSPTTNPARGPFTIDFAFPEPTPPPVTTIAWRLDHILVGVLGMRIGVALRRRADDLRRLPLPGDGRRSAVPARQATTRSGSKASSRLDDDALARPCGPAEGPYAEYPMATLVLHIHREMIHHCAEVLLLRDLYRSRPGNARPGCGRVGNLGAVTPSHRRPDSPVSRAAPPGARRRGGSRACSTDSAHQPA